MEKTLNKNTFAKLANYYDLVYKNKNYDKEVTVIRKVIKKYLGEDKINLLDLGSGTGEHCLRFAKIGYKVTGVDRSKEVIAVAKTKQTKIKNKITFIQDDISKFSSDEKFDVITCLFHVTSYLVAQKSLDNFFKVVSKQLKNNGIFIFDCWYGPGVLADKPTVSYRKYKNKNITIHRIKEPSLFEAKNLVEVKHNFFIEENSNKIISDHFIEKHLLRYFFFEEIEKNLQKAGLKIIKHGNLENDFRETTKNDYETCFIVQKIKN